ncbi:MAG: hypothetical protein WDN27_05185 [Candidatus Saccharibacteria bacterium]
MSHVSKSDQAWETRRQREEARSKREQRQLKAAIATNDAQRKRKGKLTNSVPEAAGLCQMIAGAKACKPSP